MGKFIENPLKKKNRKGIFYSKRVWNFKHLWGDYVNTATIKLDNIKEHKSGGDNNVQSYVEGCKA